MYFLTKTKLTSLSVTSFVLFIISLVLAFVIVPIVVNSQIDKNVQLVRGTEQWHRFKQLPFNLTLNVTFFEVTNAQQVIEDGEIPVLKERGPYIFDEIIKKTDIIYNDENDSISYERQIQFHFNQSKSGSDLSYDDSITLINPMYLVIMQMAKEFPIPAYLVASSIETCLNSMFTNGLLLTATVGSLMFDGIPVCDYNNKKCDVFLIGSICQFFENKTKLIEKVETVDEKYLKFSFLNFKVREPDECYEVKTGIENIDDVGSIVRWNYSTHTKRWVENRMENSCNLIEGTDGTIFQPHVGEDTKLSVFSTDICRTVDIFYDGKDTYRDIEGFIYRPEPSLLYSRTIDSHDDCFCIQRTLDVDGKKSCFLDGVMDLYPCIGVPVLLSYPHLLYADKKYLKNLRGDIEPDENKHSLYMLIDKYSGIPLRAHKRVQMNLILRPYEGFEKLSSKLPRTILPIFWMDEGIELPDMGIDLLNSLLYDTIKMVDILKWTFIGVTSALTILFSSLLAYGYCNGF